MKALRGSLMFLASVHLAAATTKSQDCRVLQEKIIQAKNNGGGEIQIDAGHYLCREPLVIDFDHVNLHGVPGARDSVVIEVAEHANIPALVIGSTVTIWSLRKGHNDFYTSHTVHDVRVSDLTIEGNAFSTDGESQQDFECWNGFCGSTGKAAIRNNGITIRGAEDVTVDNVALNNNRSGGIVAEKYSKRLHITNVSAQRNFFDGFAGYQTTESTISNSDFSNNRGAGASLDLDFSGNQFLNVDFRQNGHQGIFARALSDLKIRDSRIVGNGYQGIFLAKNENLPCANRIQVISTEIRGSGAKNEHEGAGIRMNDRECSGNCVENVRFGDERIEGDRNTAGNISADGPLDVSRLRDHCDF